MNKKPMEQYKKWKKTNKTTRRSESTTERKKTYLLEIKYHNTDRRDVETITTDDLAWSMNQYQRNRQPLTWEILDWKPAGDSRMLFDNDTPTLEDVEMIQQGIKNHESDNS